jgi:acetyltransferase-like isoleucine patch superfamily enzyme
MRKLLFLIYAAGRYLCSFIVNLLNLTIDSRIKIKLTDILKIKGVLRIYGRGEIIIGENIKINTRFSANPIGGQTFTSFYVAENAQLTIGKNVGISNSSIVSFSRIVIEDNVLIGGDCKIFDTDFHSINPEIRNSPNDTSYKSMPVTIKRGAFIGAASIILKGVVIGENSVIGAGSIVTKSVPANEIWAGNPAKFINTV